jgi:hypothetical protein
MNARSIEATIEAEPEADPDLQSIPVTANEIGLHKDTLYRLARAGQFPPAIQIGKSWMVSRPRLRRYLHGDA